MKFKVIIIGGGLAGVTVAEDLQKSGIECALISAGHSIHNMSYRAFENAGGELLMGDKALCGKIENGKLECISTEKLGKDALCADIFVLATGKFFGCGIVSDMNGIHEPVLNCDITVPEERESLFNADFAKDQAFLKIGVRTDAEGRVYVGGTVLSNVYATGEVKEGLTGAVAGGDITIEADAKAMAKQIKEVCNARE